jgi:PPOX class probable F420-dependent enzyme
MALEFSGTQRSFFEQVMFATVGTKRKDGSIQLNPVWYNYDDGYFWLNSAQGRGWFEHLMRDKDVTLLFVDPSNMYRWAQVQGSLVKATTDGADAHIDQLSARYTGNPVYQNRVPGETRVKMKIEPLRIVGPVK